LLITSADVLASVQVIDACYKSLECGSWVDVEAAARGRHPKKAAAAKRPARA
jgi:hypothetical protein